MRHRLRRKCARAEEADRAQNLSDRPACHDRGSGSPKIRSSKCAPASLEQPEHGLTSDMLEQTDVLVWRGHAAHAEVRDEIVERILTRVWQGMGLVALHSAHYSKPFKRLMGTSCSLTWREAGEKERLWGLQSRASNGARDRSLFRNSEHGNVRRTVRFPAPDEIISSPGSKAARFFAPAASDGVHWIDSLPERPRAGRARAARSQETSAT